MEFRVNVEKTDGLKFRRKCEVLGKTPSQMIAELIKAFNKYQDKEKPKKLSKKEAAVKFRELE